MTVFSSLTIDRTSLSLSPLVLTNNPFDGVPYTYPEDGLAEPNFEMRRTYAPDSAYVPGHVMLGAVMDGTTIPLIVYVEGFSITDLVAKKNALSQALAQFSYTVSINFNGVDVGEWQADATTVWWGVLDHSMTAQRRALGSISIPVNPPSA